jgi:hypothetical protein
MAHFAQIDNENIVLNVVVISNDDIQDLTFPESESIGIAFCKKLFGSDTNWVQTSYNGSFRKNYAEIGGVYDSSMDAFIGIKTYPSWVLNDETCLWQAPVVYPDDGKYYIWNEDNLTWREVVLND